MSATVEHYLRIWQTRRKMVECKHFSEEKIAEIDNLLTALKKHPPGSEMQTLSKGNEVSFIAVPSGEVIATLSFSETNA